MPPDEPEPARRNGVAAAVARIGEKIVNGLSGPFLALVTLNVAFILGIIWFVHAESALRVQIVDKVLDVCAADLGRAAR